MNNLERILSGKFDNVKNYSNNLNEFKIDMQNEVKNINSKSKEEINKMGFEELLIHLNSKGNVISKTMMLTDSLRRYPYGCMEVMEKMDTVEEKYMACLFFHYLTMAQKKSKEGEIIARAFFDRVDIGNA